MTNLLLEIESPKKHSILKFSLTLKSQVQVDY